MLNLAKHPPYHPDPGEDDKMKVDTDPCESSSIVLNDEEVAFGEKHGVFPEHTDFIMVTRPRVPHTLRFPVSYFKEESKNMVYMCKWVTNVLAEVAPVKPGSFTTALLRPSKEDPDDIPSEVDDVPPPVEYLLFNVSSAADVAAACKHGGQMKTDNGQHPCRIYFEAHTATAQALEKEREIKIGSLAWNTTNTNVRAALKDYGDIQSITTTFNSKMTMKEALVIFNSATSVTQLKEECATCLAVQDDVGTITRLGTVNVSYDPSLTVKLAGLPRGTTPADLKNVFDSEIKTPNAVRPYHTITMPLSLTTKTRQPEAYVRFSTFQQQQYALRTKIVLDGKETVWLNTNERTCFFCGRPGHFQRECDNFHAMLNQKATRRTNAAIIRGTASSTRSTPHSSPHSPLTQVPILTATHSTPSKQSTPQRSNTTSSQSRSYASAVSSPQKNKGSAASNPITISSTPSTTASPSSFPRPQAAHPNSSVPATADLESVRNDMATLNTKLDLLLNGLGVMQTSVTTPFKPALTEEPKDVEITDATDCNVIVPDSIPSTPQPASPCLSTTRCSGGTDPHSSKYTICWQQFLLCMHPSPHTHLEAIPKRKETKSEMRAVATGSYQLSRRRGLTTIQRSMSEQFQAREGAYKALQDRIEQQQAGDRTVIVHGEELQYASMTTSEIADYTGAPEIASLGSTPSSNPNPNNNNSQDLENDGDL
ncbi:MAG: hypothetical protein JOS17DRAFT_775596 [Linnemannia elongata]|nr:MAG: hypothetical protein JOS17DRAFT_775596 [Linnemannia elongata]